MAEEQAAGTQRTIEDVIPNVDDVIRSVVSDAPAPLEAPEPLEQESEEAVGPDSAPEEVSQEGEVSAEPELTADVKRDYEKALQNLKLSAKVPQSVLDAMSPEETIAWWSGLAEKKAADDRTYRERAELQKRLDDLQRDQKTEPVAPTVSPDVEAARQKLAELLDEDGAAALNTYLESRLDALAQGLHLERIRESLGNQASDPDQWEKAKELAGQMWAMPLHDDKSGAARLTALTKDALRLLGAEPVPDAIPTRETESDKQEASLRRKGSPTTRTSTPRPPKIESDEEAFEAAARLVVGNPSLVGKPEEVRRRLGL